MDYKNKQTGEIILGRLQFKANMDSFVIQHFFEKTRYDLDFGTAGDSEATHSVIVLDPTNEKEIDVPFDSFMVLDRQNELTIHTPQEFETNFEPWI
jgi:hypothetical protein